MYLCELLSLSGSVDSKESVELHPKPENMISAAVMKKILFLLVNDTTIAVYAMKKQTSRRWNGHEYYKETVDNLMNGIDLQDLGLTTDCELQRIWAGDTESGTYILHVLYQKGQDKMLASYNMDKDFLKKCER